MPHITYNPIGIPFPFWGIHLHTFPGIPIGIKFPVTAPTQIAGLVPLICATPDPRLPAFSKCDCREWTNDECYINPVFASSSSTDVNKNDHNMFLLEFPFVYQFQWTNTNSPMSLEEWNGSQWITTTTLTNNTYGTFYNFNSNILCIPYWKGFDIDWRQVLLAFGENLYRFRFSYNCLGTTGTLVSPPFCLKEWSCKGTDVTVRWETTMTGGRLGSIDDDQRVFEFCCIGPPKDGVAASYPVIWKDQIRVYAFFGREKTEYERVNIEYQNGEVIQVRNEAIQKFEYESALQPKWVHDRLKAYGLMADELYVTDYNWNNADYDIHKKRVVCDGSYEPEYNINTRYSNVKVQFKEGFQNVIRDKCCSNTAFNSRPGAIKIG